MNSYNRGASNDSNSEFYSTVVLFKYSEAINQFESESLIRLISLYPCIL